MNIRGIASTALVLLLLGLESPASAKDDAYETYAIQPGDVLEISVWKEEDLQREVLVRPDGGLSFPLVGDLHAAGGSVEDLRARIAAGLQKYIPSPVVTVAVKQILGNSVYVIGKVNKPGGFLASRTIDVMQALSMARGMTPFAAVNDIRILRREHGKEAAISFRYGDVERGRHLDQNIILQSGDVVVVP